MTQQPAFPDADTSLTLTGPAGTAEMRLRVGHAGARILLAEDEPVNQEVFRELLEDAGLWVDIAMDGVEAVALAQAGPYDLILMDMQMPVMSGLEAASRIRQDMRIADLPIVALTANTFDSDRERCLAAPYNHPNLRGVMNRTYFAVGLLILSANAISAEQPPAEPPKPPSKPKPKRV